MKRKVRDFAFQVKASGTAGEFEGYGSVFETIDAYRERVAPGAFRESLKEWAARGALPPVLWQHRADQPLGPFLEMREDDRGLFVRGKLLVEDVRQAREAHALMKSGAVSGLSIGFNVVREEFDHEEELVTLQEIDLWEVSVVTFPANTDARVEAVKNRFADGLPSVREFEGFLRDAGFSRVQAVAIASRGLSGLLRDAEGQHGEKDARLILDELVGSIICKGLNP
jgi:HK97 family phage prohead protease